MRLLILCTQEVPRMMGVGRYVPGEGWTRVYPAQG
jgi:hypothetical protein